MQPRNDSRLQRLTAHCVNKEEGINPMNSIIYIVGLIVIVMAILSFIGLA